MPPIKIKALTLPLIRESYLIKTIWTIFVLKSKFNPR
jgi:hypothetical protein